MRRIILVLFSICCSHSGIAQIVRNGWVEDTLLNRKIFIAPTDNDSLRNLYIRSALGKIKNISNSDSLEYGLITNSDNNAQILGNRNFFSCTAPIGRSIYRPEFYRNYTDIENRIDRLDPIEYGSILILFMDSAYLLNKYQSNYGLILDQCDTVTIHPVFQSGIDDVMGGYMYVKALQKGFGNYSTLTGPDSIMSAEVRYRLTTAESECCCSHIVNSRSFLETDWIKLSPAKDTPRLYKITHPLFDSQRVRSILINSLAGVLNKNIDDYKTEYESKEKLNQLGQYYIVVSQIEIRIESKFEEYFALRYGGDGFRYIKITSSEICPQFTFRAQKIDEEIAR